MLARIWNKGEEMSGYCPQWVYASCIGLASKDFLEKDIPIDLACKKYAKELSEKYDDVNPVQMASISEEIIRTLAEVEAGEEAVNYLTGFIYFLINFESAGKTRSRKMLMGSIFDGERNLQYDEKKVARSFKAYMYSLRSGAAPSAPAGWSIEQENDIDFLKEIALKEFTIFDAIQNS